MSVWVVLHDFLRLELKDLFTYVRKCINTSIFEPLGDDFR